MMLYLVWFLCLCLGLEAYSGTVTPGLFWVALAIAIAYTTYWLRKDSARNKERERKFKAAGGYRDRYGRSIIKIGRHKIVDSNSLFGSSYIESTKGKKKTRQYVTGAKKGLDVEAGGRDKKT